jgi:hypothetical protein
MSTLARGSPNPVTAPPAARATERRGGAAVELFIALAVIGISGVGAAWAFYGGGVDALLLVASTAAVSGVAGFVWHGGTRITAAGTFALTTALIAGYGGWYWATRLAYTQTSMPDLTYADSAILASAAAMYLLFWRGSRSEGSPYHHPVSHALDRSDARAMGLVGFVLLAVGEGAAARGPGVGGLADSCAYVGVVLIAAALLGRRGARPGQLGSWLLIGAALLSYYELAFRGGGRLVLVGLAVAIAIIAQYRGLRSVKIWCLIITVPGLLLFANIGRDRGGLPYNAPGGPTSLQSGIESMVSPVSDLGALIEQRINDGGGQTLVAELVTPIPRSLWPSKPDQLGRVLAVRLVPQVATNSSQSNAATMVGEWYFNFGWPGVVVMIFVIGWGIRWLDRLLLRSSRRSTTSRLDAYLFVFWAIMVGSVPDVVWNGTSTWATRNQVRILVLLPILAWAWATRRPSAREQGALVGASENA